jgi:alkyl sulfatase BDS1-like metallo-beta-lactamase superfamily hydrolase
MLDSSKAAGLRFIVNIVTPDNGEQYVLEMSNSTLTNIKGVQSATPDLTLTINRSDLEPIMMRQATFASQVAAGKARFEGNPAVLQSLMGSITPFDPAFEIMPGTRQPATANAH